MRNILWFVVLVVALLLILLLLYPRPVPTLAPPLANNKGPGVAARDCDYKPVFGIQLKCYWVELRDGNVGFTFAVAVFQARDGDAAQDPLVYIPGGPGESRNTAPLMLSVWEEWVYRTNPGRDFVLVD